MIANTNIEAMAILRHYLKLSLRATETFGRITISERIKRLTVLPKTHLRIFKGGDMSLEVNPRCVHHKIIR